MNPVQIEPTLREFLLRLDGTSGLLKGIVETLALLLLLALLQRFAYRLINQNVANVERRHQLRVWTRIIVGLLVITALIVLWFPSGQAVLQVLALLAAGLALTLSRPILGLLAWFLILLRGPFRVGDRIQIGEVRGDVVDISPMYVHIMEIGNWVDADQSTGRVAHVPNTLILERPVFNYTEGFDLIWNELHFVLTFDSDWERARTILLQQAQAVYEGVEARAISAAEQMGRRYAYQRGITTPFVYVKVLRDGIQLSLRYLTDPRRRRGTTHDITIAFLQTIEREPGIRLALPAYRIQHEG